MRILRVVAFLFAVSIVTASIAKADTLSGIWQVDDGYTAYLSTSPTSIAGATVLDTEECWDCTYTISANLTPGTTYYLMVDANNNFGNIGGTLGDCVAHRGFRIRERHTISVDQYYGLDLQLCRRWLGHGQFDAWELRA